MLMPKELEKCVNKVKKSKGEDSAWAICSKSTGYKVAKGSTKHRKKWVKTTENTEFDQFFHSLLDKMGVDYTS
jgi:hypothetical protein